MVIILEREKLYEEVWKVKMKELAKSYEISESTLRKYCRQLEVPFPQRGYWGSIAMGGTPKKAKLPKLEGKTKAIIEKYEQRTTNKIPEAKKLAHLSEVEREEVSNYCNNIRVPDRLVNTHEMIKETKIYRNDSRYGWGLRNDGVANNINLKVSKEQEKRAFRILNTIFNGFKKLGYRIEGERKLTKVCIGNMKVNIGLKEKYVRIKHVKTKEDGYGASVYDYNFSGEFELFIDDYEAPKKTWREVKGKKIEDFIGEFIITVIETAEIKRKSQEERDRKAELERQKRVEKLKLEKRREFEANKIDELITCAENYHISSKIDRFISALELKLENIDNAEEIEKITTYIEWAKKKSEWLNPIKNLDDKLMGDKYDGIYNLEYEDDNEYWWV